LQSLFHAQRNADFNALSPAFLAAFLQFSVHEGALAAHGVPEAFVRGEFLWGKGAFLGDV
jgi:hypothetical protein